jgi:acyl carrier protein
MGAINRRLLLKRLFHKVESISLLNMLYEVEEEWGGQLDPEDWDKLEQFIEEHITIKVEHDALEEILK